MFFICIVSIVNNSILNILTDLFIFNIPICFYLLVNKTDFNIKSFSKYFPILLLLGSIIAAFDVKLQFSYFSLLIVGYVLFITSYNFITVILFIILPLVLLNSLIGKSSLILLSFIFGYFLFFDRNFVTIKKKISILLLSTFCVLIFSVLFWDQIMQTGAYKNMLYFLSNTDFFAFDFRDHSTLNRLFEATQVINEFNNSNWFYKIFGHGFGLQLIFLILSIKLFQRHKMMLVTQG